MSEGRGIAPRVRGGRRGPRSTRRGASANCGEIPGEQGPRNSSHYTCRHVSARGPSGFVDEKRSFEGASCTGEKCEYRAQLLAFWLTGQRTRDPGPMRKQFGRVPIFGARKYPPRWMKKNRARFAGNRRHFFDFFASIRSGLLGDAAHPAAPASAPRAHTSAHARSLSHRTSADATRAPPTPGTMTSAYAGTRALPGASTATSVRATRAKSLARGATRPGPGAGSSRAAPSRAPPGAGLRRGLERAAETRSSPFAAAPARARLRRARARSVGRRRGSLAAAGLDRRVHPVPGPSPDAPPLTLPRLPPTSQARISRTARPAAASGVAPRRFRALGGSSRSGFAAGSEGA